MITENPASGSLPENSSCDAFKFSLLLVTQSIFRDYVQNSDS